MCDYEVFTVISIPNKPNSKYKERYLYGITLRNDGIIIITDSSNGEILGVNPNNGNIFNIVSTTDESEETLGYLYGIVTRDDGTIIVATTTNKIIGIDTNGHQFIIAGTGEEGDKDGPVNEATFNCPRGIAIRDDGTIIVADSGNHKIKGIDLDGNVFTIAGTGELGDKDGPGNEATFKCPSGIAIRDDGTIIVADAMGYKIRGIDLNGNVYTIAGCGFREDRIGSGVKAGFNYPLDVSIKKDGTILVSDSHNNRIKSIDMDGNVSNVAGSRQLGDKDGLGNESLFYYPCGITIGNDGKIFVLDTFNHKIKEIRPKSLVKSAIE